jgi:peptidoglycan hydrolase-like protein with peptidoglycan-binding domain
VQYQPPPASEAVRNTQDRLRALGYYGGPIDGVQGPETTDALQRFQAAQGLAATGRLDGATTSRLVSVTAGPQPAIQFGDAGAVENVQGRLRQLGFYNGPVDGRWGPETQAALRHFQSVRGLDVTGQPTQATMAALGTGAPIAQSGSTVAAPSGELDPAVVRDIQRRLHRLGFYNGRIDGVWGARGQSAVERFQQSRGLQPTGDLNPMTFAALGFDPNNLSSGARQ